MDCLLAAGALLKHGDGYGAFPSSILIECAFQGVGDRGFRGSLGEPAGRSSARAQGHSVDKHKEAGVHTGRDCMCCE